MVKIIEKVYRKYTVYAWERYSEKTKGQSTIANKKVPHEA
jgi:hypothetical protein